MPDERKDQDVISLADAARETGIPLDTLRSAAKAGRIAATLEKTPRGYVWYTIWSEVVHFKKTWTPKNIKNL